MSAVANRKEQAIPELEEAMEAGFEEDVEYVCDFEEGDKVVYPHHGAGLVLKKETRELMGEEREYLTIKILHNELTVMVPCENAGKAGLRRVIDEEEIKKVTDVLTDDVSEMPKNWNRRFKYNREKIKTGDVFELAEVVRNLAHPRDGEGPLHRREADVHAGEEDPRLGVHVRARQGRGGRGGVPRRAAGGALRRHGDRLAPQRPSPRSSRPPAPGRGSEPAARRPSCRWPAGRWSSGRSRPSGRPGRCARSSSPARPGTSTSSAGTTSASSTAARPARESVANALEAVGTELVAIHDAARPLVTPELVEGVVATLAADPEAAGAIAAAPVTDTIKRAACRAEPPLVPSHGLRNEALVVERRWIEALWAAQTPQVFRVEALRTALTPPVASRTADEAMLVEAAAARC